MIKNKFSLYFIFISIFTSITIFVSIVQKSYSNLIGPTKQLDTSKLLNKINPILDTDIIENIKNRPEPIDDGNLNFVQQTPEVTPTISTKKPVNDASNSSDVDQFVTE